MRKTAKKSKSAEEKPVEGKVYIIPVEVKFNYVLTEGEYKTAAGIDLSTEEYARRKFLMMEGLHIIENKAGTWEMPTFETRKIGR